ncbi:MAG TPA: IclR family transcriptional regulator C-terminal domain-containing protein [Acidobacteriaceae bacterium]|jgi:IclR family pca regulon transcriptional regulator|nr:IclR family transcriptional regulator C-terminal domain-containing protein [Acidobacteriaceae bacterium]
MTATRARRSLHGELPRGGSAADSAAAGGTAANLSAFEGDPNFVLSLARGLKVIESFDGRKEGVTVADAARHTGLSRAAVRRLLITLEILGYAECRGRLYRLRSRVLSLGFSFISSTSLVAAAQPILDHITETIHESSSMSVLDGNDIVYVARSSVHRVMSVDLSVGSRLPAYCTSMGRVLLAGLADPEIAVFLDRIRPKAYTPRTVTSKPKLREIILRVRRQGYAVVDEELEPGLKSMAVPILNRQGRTVAAINIGAPALRVRRSEAERFLAMLHEAAQTLLPAAN